VARLDRVREFVDRLHPSGLLYATYEHRLIAELDPNRLPQHVAVLADGPVIKPARTSLRSL
jgi:short-chain Z-isoprenyl diphosphate synthase